MIAKLGNPVRKSKSCRLQSRFRQVPSFSKKYFTTRPLQLLKILKYPLNINLASGESMLQLNEVIEWPMQFKKRLKVRNITPQLSYMWPKPLNGSSLKTFSTINLACSNRRIIPLQNRRFIIHHGNTESAKKYCRRDMLYTVDIPVKSNTIMVIFVWRHSHYFSREKNYKVKSWSRKYSKIWKILMDSWKQSKQTFRSDPRIHTL